MPILEKERLFMVAFDADEVVPTVCQVDVAALCPGQERGPTRLLKSVGLVLVPFDVFSWHTPLACVYLNHEHSAVV